MSSLLTVAMVSRVEVFHHTDSSWSRLFSAVMEVKAAGVRCSRLPARVVLYQELYLMMDTVDTIHYEIQLLAQHYTGR